MALSFLLSGVLDWENLIYLLLICLGVLMLLICLASCVGFEV